MDGGTRLPQDFPQRPDTKKPGAMAGHSQSVDGGLAKAQCFGDGVMDQVAPVYHAVDDAPGVLTRLGVVLERLYLLHVL